MSERTWDVVVIGAGPAGAMTAYESARRGLSVLLLDKAAFPRRKVCGCCLNGSAIETLRHTGLSAILEESEAIPLHQLRLATAGRQAVTSIPTGAALSRERLDSSLIDAAIQAGATFWPGSLAKLGAVQSAERIVHVDQQSWLSEQTARVVVLASGLSGARSVGDDTPSTVSSTSRIGAGAIADSAPRQYEPGTIFMAVDRGGYLGLVRLEDGRLDLAAAFDPGFLRECGSLGRAAETVLRSAGFPPIPGITELSWRGTPPLTRTLHRVAGERWFAVGDAAGYVEPFTGEGMAWALSCGVAVSPQIERAIQANHWDRQIERDWAAAHQKIIVSRQRICRIVSRVLRSPTLCRVSVIALSLAPWLSKPVVSRFNCPPRRIVESTA